MGIISDSSKSIAYAYAVPLLGYVCIACYSFFGQRIALSADRSHSEPKRPAVAESEGF